MSDKTPPTASPTLRGSIQLEAPLCTSCMLCVRECPAWCISLAAHSAPDDGSGVRRGRAKYVLDEFVIDYGLCIECGICIDICPTDALSWSADPMPATTRRADLSHDEC